VASGKGRRELRLEVQILGLESGGIGVGDVRGDDLLPQAQKVHVTLETIGYAV
jgi:hypothetical protein